MAKLLREDELYTNTHRAILPQHQKKDGNFAVTGENNPLPVKQAGAFIRLKGESMPTNAEDGNTLLVIDPQNNTSETFVYYSGEWRVI